ncbi:MAG: DUF222 domain-containing protein [Acidimicrobiia bacterium]
MFAIEMPVDSVPAEGPVWDPLAGGIPAGLDEWTPGSFLADIVELVDRDSLSGYDLVVLLRAEARLIAHLQALHEKTLVRILDAEVEAADGEYSIAEMWEATCGEVEAALTLTFRAAQRRLGFAESLFRDHPRIWEALYEGRIDVAKAHMIVDGLCGVAPGVAEDLTEKILVKASGWTCGQIRARLARLVAEADPVSAVEAYEESKTTRCVEAPRNWEGTANLCGWRLPVEKVAEARAYIDQLARSLKTSGETRTLDQLRADVFLDLLCGRPHTSPASGGRGVVDIRVDLETLAGLSEAPGEIPGFGPVVADIARQVAAEYGSEWQITLTHQDQPVWVGTTSRRPTTQMKRRIRARYPTCVFVGCRASAHHCDLDHNIPVEEGGQTREDQMCPLCRHHHHCRHIRWTLKRLPNHRYQWTSPLGHVYTTEHPP